MASNKKPRKKYRPKTVYLNTVELVTSRNVALSDHAGYVLSWKIKTYSAMNAMTTGQAVEEDLGTLFVAHNVSGAISVTKKLPSHIHNLEDSKAVLLEIEERGKRSGRYELKDLEMSILREMLAYYDNLMDVITVGELERALEYAKSAIGAKNPVFVDRKIKRASVIIPARVAKGS